MSKHLFVLGRMKKSETFLDLTREDESCRLFDPAAGPLSR